jgi:hypothetical protein
MITMEQEIQTHSSAGFTQQIWTSIIFNLLKL